MAVVTIFSYKGKNIVWPPYVVVKPGEELVFKSVNAAATVYLPRAEIFALAGAALTSAAARGITLSLDGASGGARIRIRGTAAPAGAPTLAGNPAPGAYPYSVYCKDSNDFAEGNSSPVIIIEPPDPVVPIYDGSNLSQLE